MQAAELLAQLIAYPTVSNRPTTAMVADLAHRLETMGFTVWQVRDADDPHKSNLLASAGPTGTDGLVLSGHMDVVPTEGQPWSSDPFAMTERDGKLYGRGTADMKGFIACTLRALDQMNVRTFKRELLLVWTYDEEVGCLGSAHLVRQLLEEDRPVPTACLVGEPTDFQVMRMHSGHYVLEIEVSGQAAHSSRPDLGCNAIEGAAEVVGVVRGLASDLAERPIDLPELDRPVVAVNVGKIHGGQAVNIVPDRCVIEVGYRPLPGTDKDDVPNELLNRLQQVHDRWRWRMTPREGIQPLLTPAGTALESLLLPHAATNKVGAAGFATDGGNLALLGTQPLVFGPGSIQVAHRADEYVQATDLDRTVRILSQLITARCITP